MGHFDLEEWELESATVKDIISSGSEYDLFSVLPHVFCEEHVGSMNVKRGLLAMLVSPYDLKMPGGRTVRNRIHILLNGDPGTGKSDFIEHLSNSWGAKHISSPPSAASLKGDARRKDKGVQIFRQYNGGMVCIDDIELMGDSDTLRDVMERGRYSMTKGGIDEEYESQCRIIAATNDLTELSLPMLSRFDLIYNFDKPSIEETLEIAQALLDFDEGGVVYTGGQLIQDHVKVSQSFIPGKRDKREMMACISKFLDDRGRGGDTGRWISSVLRISRSIAKIRLCDMGPNDVVTALQMKAESDKVLEDKYE